MKLKAVWLTTLSLSTLVLVAAVPLNKAASQLWNPDVAHAAKVTANLLKGKQLNPLLKGRRTRSYSSNQLLSLQQDKSQIQGVSTQPISLAPLGTLKSSSSFLKLL